MVLPKPAQGDCSCWALASRHDNKARAQATDKTLNAGLLPENEFGHMIQIPCFYAIINCNVNKQPTASGTRIAKTTITTMTIKTNINAINKKAGKA